MSPISDAHARDAASDHSGSEKSLFEASPVRPVPLLASGSDEEDSEDRKEVKPRASVPASGGSATVASERDTNFYLHNLEGNFFASGGSKPASGGSGPALAAERW